MPYQITGPGGRLLTSGTDLDEALQALQHFSMEAALAVLYGGAEREEYILIANVKGAIPDLAIVITVGRISPKPKGATTP